MEYTELQCEITPFHEKWSEIVNVALCDIGFESFAETKKGTNAYIPTKDFDFKAVKLLEINRNSDFKVFYRNVVIPDQNWNEVWEKNYFQPIVVGDECLIKSPFHQFEKDTKYTIVIEPKMSFGTGHHATTTLMLEQILKLNVEGKSVLDMGCGTCVLGMLASMRGAAKILAIDIDDWAYNNSIENIEKNRTPNIEVLLGDASLLNNKQFDIIFANINRNILLEDIEHYAKCMSKGSKLLVSGFYTEDIPIIRTEAESKGLKYIEHHERDNWAVVIFSMKFSD